MPWLYLLPLLLLPTLACAIPSKHTLVAKVVRVIDGDTIVVLTDGETEERIRLWGIDAPEQRWGLLDQRTWITLSSRMLSKALS